MTTEPLLTDQGVLDLIVLETVDVPSLEKASARLDNYIYELQQTDFGPIGRALLVDLQRLQDKVLDRLNALHGSDGMTLIAL